MLNLVFYSTGVSELENISGRLVMGHLHITHTHSLRPPAWVHCQHLNTDTITDTLYNEPQAWVPAPHTDTLLIDHRPGCQYLTQTLYNTIINPFNPDCLAGSARIP